MTRSTPGSPRVAGNGVDRHDVRTRRPEPQQQLHEVGVRTHPKADRGEDAAGQRDLEVGVCRLGGDVLGGRELTFGRQERVKVLGIIHGNDKTSAWICDRQPAAGPAHGGQIFTIRERP